MIKITSICQIYNKCQVKQFKARAATTGNKESEKYLLTCANDQKNHTKESNNKGSVLHEKGQETRSYCFSHIQPLKIILLK